MAKKSIRIKKGKIKISVAERVREALNSIGNEMVALPFDLDAKTGPSRVGGPRCVPGRC